MKFVFSLLVTALAALMGQLRSDGKATQGGVTWPAGTITFGELYRVGGWNGIALQSIAAADVVRTADMEIASDRIWIVKVPSGLTAPVKGDVLYWATNDSSTFQAGDTNLQTTASTTGAPPAVKVMKAKDSNHYMEVRVLNVG